MKSKPIAKRFFWSWDHSTNWIVNTPGEQISGVCNGYAKEPHVFELDYKRAADFAAEHKITAIGAAGLLRDRHGGVESLRRICSYAKEKGTLIYLIAGLFGYGGIYYEGEHKYSLNKFLEKNPEALARKRDGSAVSVRFMGRYGTRCEPQGCPSNPLLREFVLESLDWLFREIPELGGIQMESTDNSVCECPECRRRRGEVSLSEPFSLADMAAIYPDAVDTVLKNSPDALVFCETYHHFLDKECSIFASREPSDDLKKLLAMPKSVFWQWKCDNVLDNNSWRKGAPMLEALKDFRHTMRAHSGTQWWGGRNTLAVDRIRRQCELSAASGIDAVTMFGETSPYHTNTEFNYLAFEYFSDYPENTNAEFIKDIMAPRLGGASNAESYFEYATLVPSEFEKIPRAVSDIAKISSSLTDYDEIRRFQYLASFLNSYYWELSRGTDIQTMIPRGSDRLDKR